MSPTVPIGHAMPRLLYLLHREGPRMADAIDKRVPETTTLQE